MALFQFGLPVRALTAELLLGEPSEVCERGAARSSPAARRGRQPLSDPWAQVVLSSAGGSFVSSGPSGLGFLDNGAASRLRGGAARGKNEDGVDVSCVQLRADRRSISEDSGGKSSVCKAVGF